MRRTAFSRRADGQSDERRRAGSVGEEWRAVACESSRDAGAGAGSRWRMNPTCVRPRIGCARPCSTGSPPFCRERGASISLREAERSDSNRCPGAAARAVLVDRSRAVCDRLRNECDRLGTADGPVTVVEADALAWLPTLRGGPIRYRVRRSAAPPRGAPPDRAPARGARLAGSRRAGLLRGRAPPAAPRSSGRLAPPQVGSGRGGAVSSCRLRMKQIPRRTRTLEHHGKGGGIPRHVRSHPQRPIPISSSGRPASSTGSSSRSPRAPARIPASPWGSASGSPPRC